MASAPLALVRRVCLALPEAHEQLAWGEPTFRVRKRLFAMYGAADRHGRTRGCDVVWLGAPLGVQELLVRADPDRYFVPPYVGVKGWVGVELGRVTEAELRELVVQSYCLVAPKRLVALAGG
jgi:hypothetical protein